MENLGPQEERRRERRAYGLQKWECRTREVGQCFWRRSSKPVPEHVGELSQPVEKRQRLVELLIDKILRGSSGGKINLIFCVFLSDHGTSPCLFSFPYWSVGWNCIRRGHLADHIHHAIALSVCVALFLISRQDTSPYQYLIK